MLVAALGPKRIAVTPCSALPLMVTDVPPAAVPDAGDTDVIVGVDPPHAARYLNWSAADVALVPSALVTVTSTVPQPAGAVAVSWSGDATTTLVAAAVPKLTVALAVKSVPVTGPPGGPPPRSPPGPLPPPDAPLQATRPPTVPP